MDTSFATYADYFRLGVETGSIEPSSAKNWADQIIAQAEQAPGDIVEVAFSQNAPQLLNALACVAGDRDKESASRWLLRQLLTQLQSGRNPHKVIQAARHLVLSAGMDISLHEILCSIDDSLSIAELGYHGTVSEATSDLAQFLENAAAPSLPQCIL